MKLKLPLIAAFVAVLSLSACGGGSDSPTSGSAAVSSPSALSTTDITVGTGATAANGQKVQVYYTGWLYDSAKTDFKGTQFDSNVGKQLFAFTLGATNTSDSAIPGFSQGIVGMKVGGKRTILIPASLGYGASGYGPVPGNSGLVFEVTLVGICANSSCT